MRDAAQQRDKTLMAAEMVGYKEQKKLGKEQFWAGVLNTSQLARLCIYLSEVFVMYCTTCRLRAQFKRQYGKRSPGRGQMV